MISYFWNMKFMLWNKNINHFFSPLTGLKQILFEHSTLIVLLFFLLSWLWSSRGVIEWKGLGYEIIVVKRASEGHQNKNILGFFLTTPTSPGIQIVSRFFSKYPNKYLDSSNSQKREEWGRIRGICKVMNHWTHKNAIWQCCKEECKLKLFTELANYR